MKSYTEYCTGFTENLVLFLHQRQEEQQQTADTAERTDFSRYS